MMCARIYTQLRQMFMVQVTGLQLIYHFFVSLSQVLPKKKKKERKFCNSAHKTASPEEFAGGRRSR